MAQDLKVTLSGYNIDFKAVRNRSLFASPETLSAAYARISRSSKTLEELREDALRDVEATRASNQRIVFDMGHASIAEHAVLNFDIQGISRLALEALEEHRFASFTEKSQRYVKFEKDYVIPVEIEEARKSEFVETLDMTFEAYRRFTEVLTEMYVRQGKKEGAARRRAMEDARYVLPLATRSQVGMTVNARELEYMGRSFAAHPLQEVRKLGDFLVDQAVDVAPSLIRYTEPSPYDQWRYDPDDPGWKIEDRVVEGPEVIDANDDGDLMVLSALYLRATGKFVPPSRLKTLSEAQIKAYVYKAFALMGPHDPAPREFEHARLTFVVRLSASAYAQFKRHRLISMTSGPYREDLGWTVPEAIKKAGLEAEFNGILDTITQRALKFDTPVRYYLFTNAHRRLVIASTNLRELYHFSRLRMDRHAQWEIRDMAKALAPKVQEVFPISAALLAGKDTFEEVKKALF